MLTENVGHGQRVGSGSTTVSSTARAVAPRAPPANTAANSRRSCPRTGRLPFARLARSHPGVSQNETMVVHPRAGQPAAPDYLVDLSHLVPCYYTREPDAAEIIGCSRVRSEEHTSELQSRCQLAC